MYGYINAERLYHISHKIHEKSRWLKTKPFQWLHHQEARGFLAPTAGAVAMLRQPYEQQSGGVLGTLQSVKDTYEKDLKEPLFLIAVWSLVNGASC